MIDKNIKRLFFAERNKSLSDSIQQLQTQISVADFVKIAPAHLDLQILENSAAELDTNYINSSRIQKLGLAFAGFSHYIHKGRLQIIGQSEIAYLDQLTSEQRSKVIENIDLDKISCVLITKNLKPQPELRRILGEHAIPILVSSLVSSSAISVITGFLEELLAPSVSLHGVLLEIYGVGVLLRGISGIGKSECALDLISRGHRLVADDSVIIKRIGINRLVGFSPAIIKSIMEIRGLGIINIEELFGVSAVAESAPVELCIRLERWENFSEIDRLHGDKRTLELLEMDLPKIVLPVSPGRNLAVLVETAVRVHLLQMRGYNALDVLLKRHDAQIAAESEKNSRQN